MDQIKTGKFIASLRREKGLTQEQLGEKLGVTNKTISRWENGNHMPDIEMLQLLAGEFDVSINELLSGERIRDDQFRQKADENIIKISRSSVFSEKERRDFFKRKWRKEHRPLFIFLAFIFIASVILPFAIGKTWLIGLSPLIALAEYCYQNNKMMSYVESCLYK